MSRCDRRRARPRPSEQTGLDVPAPDAGASVRGMVLAAYWNVARLLEARGRPAAKAHDVALRTGVAMFLVDVAGVSIEVAAGKLNVSVRQVERDLAVLRSLGREALEPSVFPPIPRQARRAA